MQKQFIMTSPQHFNGDATLAAQQWSELRNSLITLGCDIIVRPAPSGQPLAALCSDAGLILDGDFFIPSRFKSAIRQTEEPGIFNYFSTFFQVKTLIDPKHSLATFESGDALFDSNGNLWFGFGMHSSGAFKFILDMATESSSALVRPLEIAHGTARHLNSYFCPLDTGTVLWYPPAFSDHAQYVIESVFRGKNIAVFKQDMEMGVCNSISIDDVIVTPKITPFMVQHLTSKGYTVIENDVSEFVKHGGGCKSLVLHVNQ